MHDLLITDQRDHALDQVGGGGLVQQGGARRAGAVQDRGLHQDSVHKLIVNCLIVPYFCFQENNSLIAKEIGKIIYPPKIAYFYNTCSF